MDTNVRALQKKILQLETQVELLKNLLDEANRRGLAAGRYGPPDGNIDTMMVSHFYKMTLKQHAVTMMMVRGANSYEIAERLECSASTVKSMIASVMHRFGASNRMELAAKIRPVVAALSDEEFEKVTGLRKDWDEKFDEGDPVNKRLRAQTRGGIPKGGTLKDMKRKRRK